MGNSKSSVQLSESFDKDTEFNCENDDGGFLEAKLKNADSNLSRGQTGRKSFHYIRMRDNNDPTLANSNNVNSNINGISDKLKRVHSLPLSRIKKNKGAPTLSKKDAAAANGSKPGYKVPVQGFDLFRHHLGQMNCDMTLFQGLESEIHALNEKLIDIQQTRQSCLDKLNELHKDVRQNSLRLLEQKGGGNKKHKEKNDLALTIIHNYIERINGLLNVDEEPFLLDVQHNNASSSKSGPSSDMMLPLSSQRNEQHQLSYPNKRPIDKPSEKRQQIKDAYNQLIMSVMPKLFGKQFAHRNEANYINLRQNLADLREQVHTISTSDEQKLVDAKRIFLQEIDGYLRTLDEMITCNDKNCIRCKK